ncbi:MAG: hypothetical protein K8R40_13535 [Anaerolineaceae bacterium]|nr:hypothetical protein [Anaerolineaceae bacterium]
MKENNCKENLNLSQPTTYIIKVPGHLDHPWADWYDEIIAAHKIEGTVLMTCLTVKVDQAALQGLLRRLYNIGLPIISIECVG